MRQDDEPGISISRHAWPYPLLLVIFHPPWCTLGASLSTHTTNKQTHNKQTHKRQNNEEPLRVAVTGAAGQIAYALLFRIASGQMLGKDQPVLLQLLEIPPAMDALGGLVMELEDCAFPLLAGIEATDQPEQAFKEVSHALLVGSRPRGPGMERKDLLAANAAIFSVQVRHSMRMRGEL